MSAWVTQLRREIVQSVEDQIHELLRREESEPSRDAVLSVLASLDPPEAYRDAESSPSVDAARGARIDSPQRIADSAPRYTPLAVVSCILGVLSVVGVIVWPISLVAGLGATACGSIALTQIYYSNRFKGVWPSIVGVCSPAIAMLTLIVLDAI